MTTKPYPVLNISSPIQGPIPGQKRVPSATDQKLGGVLRYIMYASTLTTGVGIGLLMKGVGLAKLIGLILTISGGPFFILSVLLPLILILHQGIQCQRLMKETSQLDSQCYFSKRQTILDSNRYSHQY